MYGITATSRYCIRSSPRTPNWTRCTTSRCAAALRAPSPSSPGGCAEDPLGHVLATFFHAPKKAGGHRALADILESIDELRYYREVLFPAGEGPSSQECKDVAERILNTPTR